MARHTIDINNGQLPSDNRKLVSALERKRLEGILSLNYSLRELKLLGYVRPNLAARYGEVTARATHELCQRLQDENHVKTLSTQDLTIIASHATQRMQELEKADGDKREPIDWSKIDMSKFDQTQSNDKQ